MNKVFTFFCAAVLATLAVLGCFTLFGDGIREEFGASAQALSDGSSEGSSGLHRKKLLRTFGAENFDGASSARTVSAETLAGAPGLNSSASTSTSAAAPRALAPALEPRASGNTHAQQQANPFTLTRDDALSTFAVDVDTASYALFRRTVGEGALPHADSVRVEEWVNYFRYRLPEPAPGRDFHVDLEAAPSPFTRGRHLLKVGLQARKVARSQRKPTHLVFLVDTSGSMNGQDRLELAKTSMKLAVGGLNEADTVAITTYAGEVRTVLEPTPAGRRAAIEEAIDSLSASGGTGMGDGLELAYRQAARRTGRDTVSRVVVLTDGDTNLGRNRTADDMLKSIEGYVKEGVTLSTIGFGMGNYRDDLMERLANKGNGNCFYIDSEREARRVFQERLAGTLEVVAQDVKVQVDFAPDAVRGYRLLGYENRDVADRDFRNDTVDAGEVGAGHAVTALYEVELTGEGSRLATVRVRAKQPGGSEAAEQRFTLERHALRESLEDASADLRFATAVAGTADLLRGAPQAQDWSLATAEALAEDALDDQPDRAEFLRLLRRVRELRARNVFTSRGY